MEILLLMKMESEFGAVISNRVAIQFIVQWVVRVFYVNTSRLTDSLSAPSNYHMCQCRRR